MAKLYTQLIHLTDFMFELSSLLLISYLLLSSERLELTPSTRTTALSKATLPPDVLFVVLAVIIVTRNWKSHFTPLVIDLIPIIIAINRICTLWWETQTLWKRARIKTLHNVTGRYLHFCRYVIFIVSLCSGGKRCCIKYVCVSVSQKLLARREETFFCGVRFDGKQRFAVMFWSFLQCFCVWYIHRTCDITSSDTSSTCYTARTPVRKWVTNRNIKWEWKQQKIMKKSKNNLKIKSVPNQVCKVLSGSLVLRIFYDIYATYSKCSFHPRLFASYYAIFDISVHTKQIYMI